MPVDQERLDRVQCGNSQRLAEEQVVVIFRRPAVYFHSVIRKYPPSRCLNFALRAQVPIYPASSEIGRPATQTDNLRFESEPDELNQTGQNNKAMLDELTFTVMSKIYALGGLDYQVLMGGRRKRN